MQWKWSVCLERSDWRPDRGSVTRSDLRLPGVREHFHARGSPRSLRLTEPRSGRSLRGIVGVTVALSMIDRTAGL